MYLLSFFIAELRAKLAIGVNLERTNLMWNVVDLTKYVLTPDFALKLLVLNERRKVNSSVILCGGTGVGKTELLTFFSEISSLFIVNLKNYKVQSVKVRL